jgi:hypothetical protein
MAEKMSESEKKKEDWMNSKWRPMMGWMYMGVCIFDFVLAPVLWSLTQALFHGGVNVQWQPLTLQGAGLFHISMGAVLGLAAYGRTQEKLAGANNGGITLPANVGTTYTPPPAVGQQPSNFGAPVATTITQSFGTPAPVTNSWGSQPLGAASGMGTPTADVTMGWGGKKAPPAITDFPER